MSPSNPSPDASIFQRSRPVGLERLRQTTGIDWSHPRLLTDLQLSVGRVHFDLVRKDRKVRYRHNRLLGELLDVVGESVALQDYSFASTHDSETAASCPQLSV
jgi:hypothetical protein